MKLYKPREPAEHTYVKKLKRLQAQRGGGGRKLELVI